MKRKKITQIELASFNLQILASTAEYGVTTLNRLNQALESIKNKCSHDCKDCDSREVVGDEEHCLQGEEMN